MIEGLHPYAAYTNSGLRTIGRIPSHWRMMRAKTLFREVDERSTSGKEALLSVSHISGVRRRSEVNATMFLAKSNVGHKLCRPNDLVINTMWAWMGALGVSPLAGMVSPAYGVYRPLSHGTLAPGYVDYALRAPSYVAEYNIRSSGIHSSRLRLYPEHFLRIPIVAPPRGEQESIVRFLDHANRRIDRFIRAKRRLIALLNEQKQAIIHRAVTRGLHPNVPTKSSGVEWLEEIPAHWNVQRLKTLSTLVTSGSRGWARFYSDSGSVFLRIGNISTSSIDLRTRRLVYVRPPPDSEGERTRTIAGDLLLSITAQIGAVGVVPKEFESSYINQHTALIRLREGAALSRWVGYVLLSPFGKAQCRLLTNGGTKVGLTLDDVRCLSILCPPADEQTRLVSAIELQCQGVEDSIVRIEREVALIREYRARLIADVVTGQLDVREAAARLPASDADEPAPADLDDDATDDDLDEAEPE